MRKPWAPIRLLMEAMHMRRATTRSLLARPRSSMTKTGSPSATTLWLILAAEARTTSPSARLRAPWAVTASPSARQARRRQRFVRRRRWRRRRDAFRRRRLGTLGGGGGTDPPLVSANGLTGGAVAVASGDERRRSAPVQRLRARQRDFRRGGRKRRGRDRYWRLRRSLCGRERRGARLDRHRGPKLGRCGRGVGRRHRA